MVLIIVQILLESFVACPEKISPVVPAELLGFLARTYKAWYQAMVLLKRQTPSPEAHSAITQISTSLNERDILAGLWYRVAQVSHHCTIVWRCVYLI